jgi:hypothetical protein
MADQLNVIKTMILNIEDKLAQQDSQYRRANRKLHGAVAELSESVQSCTSLPNSGYLFFLKISKYFKCLSLFSLNTNLSLPFRYFQTGKFMNQEKLRFNYN